MTRPRRATPMLAVCAAVAVAASAPDVTARWAGSAAGVESVEIVIPGGADTLFDITPTLIVQAVGILPEDRPITLGLQVSTSPGFTAPLFLDTTVAGDTVPIALARPLPEGTLFFRATALPAGGVRISSPTARRVVPPWIRLVAPNELNGTTLETTRPRFVWRAVRVSDPPGPFTYELQIRNVGSSRTVFYSHLADTAFVVPIPLDINTSYRWSVTGRLASGEQATAQSQGSFVILDPAIPVTTLLYQNFPNPFPTVNASSTCIWFDLSVPGPVRMDIHDLQGRLVRNVIPGESGQRIFPAGRHGRVAGGGTNGECNGTIRWDGRGQDGRLAPAGVYLLRMRTDQGESVKKIVFRRGR
jgi:hypothetical protein